MKGYHESRSCSRDTYPESHITKYNSIRRLWDSRKSQRWLDTPRSEERSWGSFQEFGGRVQEHRQPSRLNVHLLTPPPYGCVRRCILTPPPYGWRSIRAFLHLHHTFLHLHHTDVYEGGCVRAPSYTSKKVHVHSCTLSSSSLLSLQVLEGP